MILKCILRKENKVKLMKQIDIIFNMIVAIKIINEMHQEINSTQNEREKT
jgi:hypothetical protein